MNSILLGRLRRANEFLDKEDEQSAIQELDEALRLDPQSAQAYLLRADAHSVWSVYDGWLSR
jgi:Tfp pilus assembly protein PilF